MSASTDMIKRLQQQPFLAELPEEYFELIADCAELKDFAEGEYLIQQNQKADVFYLLLEGRVSLQVHLPAQGVLPIETVQAPAALGWSWLVAPYKWHYDVTALSGSQTILVHTPCILGKVAQDQVFGYEMYKRFIDVIVTRLHSSHLQMMDVYASPEQPPL